MIDFKINMSDSLRQIKLTRQYKKKFKNFNKEIKSYFNNYFIENYCVHGNLIINKQKFKRLYSYHNENKQYLYCDKCKEEYLKNKVYTQKEINHYHKQFLSLISNSKSTFFYIKRFSYYYFPDIYNLILKKQIQFKTSWEEACFMFKNKLDKIPICINDNCFIKTTFSKTSKHYNLYCDKHANNKKSKEQTEIFNFIKEHYKNSIKKNVRNVIYGEIDIYLSDIKLGIEYNGLYWHSDMFKTKDFHYKKWKEANQKGINLLMIWEDDWRDKKDIIKSVILNKINHFKLSINKYTIKNVDIQNTKTFLNENHLLGYVNSDISIGLFEKDKLISIMSFKDNGNNYYELLRFSNKIYTNIVDSEIKLFNYFLENYNPNKIISYDNCDINNNHLFNILEFKRIKHTGINYWFYYRNNRINSNKGNLRKIYGTGQLKYEKNC